MRLTAKRTTGTADFAHPAWAVYRDENPYPLLRIDLVPGPLRWEIVALSGRYGLSYSDEELAREVQAKVTRDMDITQVLRTVRHSVEAQDEMFRQEAEAERETERRAEAFWENRMSDEDKAREDEEYAQDEWLQALEMGRR